MAPRSNGKIKAAEFQAKVLTHLDYIKKAQDGHDKKIDKINDKIDLKDKEYHDRFQTLEKDVDTAKGQIAHITPWMHVSVK